MRRFWRTFFLPTADGDEGALLLLVVLFVFFAWLSADHRRFVEFSFLFLCAAGNLARFVVSVVRRLRKAAP